MIDLTASRTLTVEGPFRLPLMLANLGRRPNEIVDLVAGDEYRRLLVHQDRPLLLRAGSAGAGGSEVRLTVHGIDVPPTPADLDFAARALHRVLSLEHSPQPFYDHVQDEPVLGPLTRRLWGLRPLGSPTIFEMLVMAILGQRISLIAAGAIKARMVRALARSAVVDGHTYYTHPAPEALAQASHEDLIALAFSRRKAEYIRDLARSVASGALDLEALRGLPHAMLIERLIALRGIGRWTAEYVLLRGYGYDDALPAGDAGLRRQIWRRYALPAPPTEAEIIRMSQPWSPYRSWATLYLWNAGLLRRLSHYLACLCWVRRQRVHTRMRFGTPLIVRVTFCRLGLKVRLVTGARRNHPPPALWRMLRPKVVLLPQISQEKATSYSPTDNANQ